MSESEQTNAKDETSAAEKPASGKAKAGKSAKIVVKHIGPPGSYIPDPPVGGRDYTEAEATALLRYQETLNAAAASGLFEVASGFTLPAAPARPRPSG